MYMYLLLRNSATPGGALLHHYSFTASMGQLHKGARRSSPPQLKTRPVAKPDAPPLNAAGRTRNLVRLEHKQYGYQVHRSLHHVHEANRLHSWLFTAASADPVTLDNIEHAQALHSK